MSPWGEVYLSPTPLRGPLPSRSRHGRASLGGPKPFQERSKNQLFLFIDFWSHFGSILAPKMVPETSQNQPNLMKHHIENRLIFVMVFWCFSRIHGKAWVLDFAGRYNTFAGLCLFAKYQFLDWFWTGLGSILWGVLIGFCSDVFEVRRNRKIKKTLQNHWFLMISHVLRNYKDLSKNMKMLISHHVLNDLWWKVHPFKIRRMLDLATFMWCF